MEGNEAQVNDQPEVTPAEENNQETPQSYELAGWTAGLPAEQKEKYAAELSKYQKIGDFAQKAFEAQDRLSRAIVRPGENATEEELAAYREAIGMPIDKEGYELTAEGSGTESFLESMKELAFEKNLSQDQAQAMVDHFMATEAKAKEFMETERINFIENSVKELQAELGTNYQPKMLKAQRMVKTHFGEEFAGFLEESQLGNDPRFIRGMIAMAEKISEDSLDNPAGGSQ
jgi:hypothetical protein